MEEEMGRSGINLEIECPTCGNDFTYRVTSDRVSMIPMISVQVTLCPACGSDITDRLETALNAPLIFAVNALKEEHVQFTNKRLFDSFVKSWNRLQEIVREAEYLTPREKSIFQDVFGFNTGRSRSLQDVGLEYGLTKQGVHALIVSGYHKVVANNEYDLRRYLDPLLGVNEIVFHGEEGESPEGEGSPHAEVHFREGIYV